MPQQPGSSTENNFSQGLKTEYTVLNFPENAVTDTLNCIFERIGNVHRRPGIDYETNYQLNSIDRTGNAVSSYVWTNAGGDGNTKVLVKQVGNTIYFYVITNATIASPLSTTKLTSTVSLSSFVASGGSIDSSLECQYATGNGYLFIFRSDLDSVYCTYASGTVTGNVITLQIRDFLGIPETGVDVTFRPSTLSAEHNYNLQNQGWTSAGTSSSGFPLVGTAAAVLPSSGAISFGISSGLSLTNGDTVSLSGKGLSSSTGTRLHFTASATVTAYSGTSLTLNIISSSWAAGSTLTVSPPDSDRPTSYDATLAKTNTGQITTWLAAEGNYPSNADVWWTFKDSTGVFAPATTQTNTNLNNAPAPSGHYTLSAFNQTRSTASSMSGLTDILTIKRPRTGSWFQGRVWFTGVDASQAATGDAGFYTWTENVYFSKIVTSGDTTGFGNCYQTNDPTAETLFSLLPSDGGVIVIQGSGSIYKLFPIQNGMLVFAANGIWFITGSQGIGFTANDYTITKISGIQSISSTSYVDVQGMPVFWNEEGIYGVVNSQSGLQVQPLTFTTIQSFYQDIPLTSRKNARGAYNPLTWEVRWIYRSTEETGATDRYEFDNILLLNTTTQSFSTWTVGTSSSSPTVNGIQYIQSPGGSTAPDPTIKYVASTATSTGYNFTFAEENDTTTYTDWNSTTGVDFTSYFVSGFKIHGMGMSKVQIPYVYIYVNNNVNNSYRYQGIWDFAINRSSGKYTPLERKDVTTSTTNFSTAFNRHRISGRGLSYQFKISSSSGQPFDLLGWSVQERKNMNP